MRVWTDCTRPDATVSDWPKAWSKLADLERQCSGHLRHVHRPREWSSCTGSPFVTFVIDRSAETDALPQTVHLPADVEPATLVATPLVSLTEDGHPTLDDSVILLLPIDDSIEIRLRIPQPPPAPGHYLSVVCEPKAGDPGPNPLTNSGNPPLRG